VNLNSYSETKATVVEKAFKLKEQQVKVRIAKFYSFISKIYDLLSSFEWGLIENKIKPLNPGEKDVILDVGCGTSRVVEWFAKRCKMVYGVDTSKGMVKVAKRKIFKKNLFHNVELCLADAAHLPFRNECFNLVTVIFTLEILSQDEAKVALKEILRVLRRNGKFLVVSLLNKPCKTLTIYKWLNKMFPTIVNCKPINSKELAEKAGFEVKEEHEEPLYNLPVEVVLAIKR